MDQQPFNWKQILATAVITGIVTLGTGMALFTLQQRNPRLEYSVADTIPFEGQQEKLAIYHITIRNDGKCLVEDVACSISVKPAVIKTSKVQADATLKYTEMSTNDVHWIDIKGLNPHEAVTVSLLASSLTSFPAHPAVALRGKNITGEEADPNEKTPDKKWPWFPALAAAYAGLASVFFLQRQKFRSIFPFLPSTLIEALDADDEHHRGDQNEIIAYLFGLQGLHEQVEYYLRKAEGCSYWSESDRIASLAIQARDEEFQKKCLIILTDLLKYAQSAPSSQGIIHYNLARILKTLGDGIQAEKHIAEAKKTIPKLLTTRLELDPLFKGE